MNKNLLPYVSLYAVLLCGVVSLLLCYPKADLHLLLNFFHAEWLDWFFRYYSRLAEAPLYVIALLAIYFLRWRWVAFYASCELAGALVVQVLKHIFRQPRPMVFFRDLPQYELPVVPGVHLHRCLSFPSGHTSTFFIFFTCCALFRRFITSVRFAPDRPKTGRYLCCVSRVPCYWYPSFYWQHWEAIRASTSPSISFWMSAWVASSALLSHVFSLPSIPRR